MYLFITRPICVDRTRRKIRYIYRYRLALAYRYLLKLCIALTRILWYIIMYKYSIYIIYSKHLNRIYNSCILLRYKSIIKNTPKKYYYLSKVKYNIKSEKTQTFLAYRISGKCSRKKIPTNKRMFYDTYFNRRNYLYV